MDFGNFEEAVTVVANPLKLRKDLFMETSAAFKWKLFLCRKLNGSEVAEIINFVSDK